MPASAAGQEDDYTPPGDGEDWRSDFACIYESGLFDHSWYAARYPDVGPSGLRPLEHYVKYGARIGRQPFYDFQPASAQEPSAPFVNPLAAWVRDRRLGHVEPDLAASSTPRVSVLCITYNQVGFIRQAIDSILSQDTGCEFEVLIGDDHSTDGTAEVVEEYAREHGNIIAVLRSENIGPNANFSDIARRARGQYVAVCEGDDYWTDSRKLRLQVEYLDRKPEFALCFHPVRVIYEGLPGTDEQYPDFCGPELLLDELTRHNLIQTNSVMYRWRYKERTLFELDSNIAPGDWYVHLLHAEVGRIGYIDRVMAVYRKHPKGLWASHQTALARHKKLGNSEIAFYRRLRDRFSGDFLDRFEAAQKSIFHRLFEHYLEEDEAAEIASLIHSNPDIAGSCIREAGLDPSRLRPESAESLRTSVQDQLSVSVVVTAFNQVGYIRRCLDSVLAQRGLFRLQIVIGDDCSSDGTAEVIEEYKRRYPEMIVSLSWPKNIGMLANMKACLEVCDGDFLAFCEGDDYWLSDRKIAKQLAMMRADSALGMCFNWVLLEIEGIGSYLPHPEQGALASGRLSFFALARTPLTANFSCCFYRARAVQHVPLSYFDGTSSADWLFNLYIANSAKIAFLRDLLSVYTVQEAGQWSGLPERLKRTRVDQYRREFATIFGEGRGFEDFEVACRRERHRGLQATEGIAHLDLPIDSEWRVLQDGDVTVQGWILSVVPEMILVRADVHGWVESYPLVVERPDVVAEILGGMPVSRDLMTCGFCFKVPYRPGLQIDLSIEVGGRITPWFSLVFVQRAVEGAARRRTTARLDLNAPSLEA